MCGLFDKWKASGRKPPWLIQTQIPLVVVEVDQINAFKKDYCGHTILLWLREKAKQIKGLGGFPVVLDGNHKNAV